MSEPMMDAYEREASRTALAMITAFRSADDKLHSAAMDALDAGNAKAVAVAAATLAAGILRAVDNGGFGAVADQWLEKMGRLLAETLDTP